MKSPRSARFALAGAVLFGAPAVLAQPIVIVDRSGPSVDGSWVSSQVFPDAPPQDAFAFDEFTTQRDWLIDQLYVYGVESGDPTCNQQVVGQIWQGRPGDGGAPIMTGSGVQIGADLDINFGAQPLPPGDYMLTAFVVRPQSTPCVGGQWGWLRTDDVYGFEAGFWNPGGGYGFDPVIGKVTDTVLATEAPADMRFQLLAISTGLIDCNANGVEDFTDIDSGASFDTNENGVPDECERDGLGGWLPDFDLDGVPDDLDPEPTIYSSVPFGGGITSVVVNQLDFPESFYADSASTTEHGAVTLTLPTEPYVDLYVNIEVDGVCAVQNRLIYTEALPDEEPTQDYVFYFDLGVPRGTPVASASYRVWVDPIGFTPAAGCINQPLTYTPTPVTVEPAVYLVGYLDGAPDKVTVPQPANPTSTPPTPVTTTETVTNDGLEVTDLDRSWERRLCAANGVGGSFAWLDKTYNLGMGRTVDSVVQEFRRMMGCLNGKGTSKRKRLEAKKAFIRKHNLPLTVESKGIPTNLDATPTPADIHREMKRGQDVEIAYGFYKKDATGKWKRSGGHLVAMKSSTVKTTGSTTENSITFRHDWSQSRRGGVADVQVELTQKSIDLDNDGTPETVWVLDNAPFGAKDKTRVIEDYTAESPTVSQLLKNISEALNAHRALSGPAWADGTVTLEEAKELLKAAQELVRRWERFLANLTNAEPPNEELIKIAKRGVKSAKNIRKQWKDKVKQQSGGGKSVLPEDGQAFTILEEDSMEFDDLAILLLLAPPDADFDDVEDILDNAPFDANPDQADEDMNGIPDVLELDPITDCNDNGIIDAHEVTIFDVVGYNFDGTPNYGFIYDQDMTGIPDDCELVPVDCIGDVNDDGVTDVFDFGDLASNFGAGPDAVPEMGDLNSDGEVNVFDFAQLAANFGCNGFAP